MELGMLGSSSEKDCTGKNGRKEGTGEPGATKSEKGPA